LTSATNAALNPNSTYQLDSIASLINGNNKLQQQQQLLQFSTNNQANANKRANNLSPSSSSNNNSSQQMNGQLNTSDVQKILKLSESDPHAMLMMNNLDLMSSNRNSTNVNSGSNNNMLTGINNSNFSANDDDEEMNDDEMSDINESSKQTNGTKVGYTSSEPMSDADTEDALKEFSFLTNEPSSDDQTDWNVDKIELANKMEQYKKDRTEQFKKDRQKQSLASHSLNESGGNYSENNNSDQWNKINSRPNRQALQAMIANLNENQADSSDLNVKINNNSEQNTTSATTTTTTTSNANQKINNFSFSNSPKLFLEDDAFGNDSNLGELSRISVNNNNVSLSGINDETIVDVRFKIIN
jgi:hypothetical protein